MSRDLATAPDTSLAPPSAGAAYAPSGPVMNTTVNVGGPNILIAQRKSGPGFFVRAIWFVVIGFWLGYLTIALAYLCIATIVLIPAGMKLLNKVPAAMTLRQRNTSYGISHRDGLTVIEETTKSQVFWLWRLIYFLPVGLILSFIWVNLAYITCLTIIGMPLGFWMYNRVGAVATLYRT